MKLRNKINEQEGQHQEMFETINEKLQDESFIQQAIDMKGKQQISVKSKSNKFVSLSTLSVSAYFFSKSSNKDEN